ncbi:hypothetical protein Nepgr_029719 [Nepenthes gracilis]|uniref:Uncharacterized protein n=1 Tax=Nepenthes gracilis TaxID=150966 RepID=A0AAD3TFK7_NEPGR|nr:hypothetical protein Nepgr_029719 [Nepenthes gracilis]
MDLLTWPGAFLPLPDLACGGCRFGLRLDGLSDMESLCPSGLEGKLPTSHADLMFGMLIRLDRHLAGGWCVLADSAFHVPIRTRDCRSRFTSQLPLFRVRIERSVSPRVQIELPNSGVDFGVALGEVDGLHPLPVHLDFVVSGNGLARPDHAPDVSSPCLLRPMVACGSEVEAPPMASSASPCQSQLAPSSGLPAVLTESANFLVPGGTEQSCCSGGSQ